MNEKLKGYDVETFFDYLDEYIDTRIAMTSPDADVEESVGHMNVRKCFKDFIMETWGERDDT